MFIPKNMGLFVLNAKLNVLIEIIGLNIIRNRYVPYCLNLNHNFISS